MPSPLVEAHIEGERRLRVLTERALTSIWGGLPGHDRENLDQWISEVLPVVEAAQRQSVNLTNAYLARSLERQPLPLDTSELIGAAVRNGTPPAEVYERPFITLWGGLSDGLEWADAARKALDRSTGMAAWDVQASMRATAAAVGRQDAGIYGFQRVPDGNACQFCLVASTQRYHSEDLMPLHNHCGCGIEPLTDEASASGVIHRDLYRELKADGVMDRLTAQRQGSRYRQRAEGNRQRAERASAELKSEPDPARQKRLRERADRYQSRADQQEATANSLAAGEVRARVVEHGEMGPTLVSSDHSFTTESQLH